MKQSSICACLIIRIHNSVFSVQTKHKVAGLDLARHRGGCGLGKPYGWVSYVLIFLLNFRVEINLSIGAYC